jgi:hypothetical protein
METWADYKEAHERWRTALPWKDDSLRQAAAELDTAFDRFRDSSKAYREKYGPMTHGHNLIPHRINP